MFKKNKEKTQEGKIVTKESLSSTCALFSLLAIIILCTRSWIFGEFGWSVHGFLTGIFGYLAYPVLLGVLYLSIMSLIGKRLVKNRRLGVCVAFTALFLSLAIHTAVTYSWSAEGYLVRCFRSGEQFPNTAPCGILGGLAVYGLAKGVTNIGAVVVFSGLAIFCGYLCYITAKRKVVSVEKRTEEIDEGEGQAPEQPVNEPAYAYADATPSFDRREPTGQIPTPSVYSTATATQRPGVSLDDRVQSEKGYSPFAVGRGGDARAPYDSREVLFGGTPAENYKKNLLFDPNSRVNQRTIEAPTARMESSYTPSYTKEYENSIDRAQSRPAKVVENSYEELRREVTPPSPPAPVPPVEEPTTFLREERGTPFVSEPTYTPPASYAEPKEEVPPTRVEPTTEYKRHDYMDLFSPANPNVFGNDEESARMGRDFADRALGVSDREQEEGRGVEQERGGIHLFDEEPYERRAEVDETPIREEIVDTPVRDFENRSRGLEMDSSRDRDFEIESTRRTIEEPVREVEPPKPVPAPPPPPKPRVIRPYVRARLDDFDCRDIEPTSNEEEVQLTKENILATLEEFKISGASIASVTFGPTVTRYNVTIPRSISPKKVVALDQSIAINLHSSGVNIYPNYEDGVVSIEVPNRDRQFVQLGCMLSGDTFVNAKTSSIMFAMGKDVANRKIYGDITKMIHLLVAGSSGSGKSVFLGSLIISLIYKYSPEELRLILIDPKKTEFVLYNNLPHLMINEIITDAGKAVQSLNWAIGEMNRRYTLFEQMSRSGKYVVNLDQYNEQLEKAERLPKIVIIIDELADLMLAAKKEMEDRIQNLTQKARAAGIHLIVATQRPSTDVITGVIKSNLPTRVAFYVATDVDSRVILDQTGAQKLLGKGDFLYTMPGINVPVRVQSAFISPEESQRVVQFIKNNNEAYYDEEATAFINNRGGNGGSPSEGGDGNGGVDPMYIDALRYVIQSNSASISMIQRKCTAGYNRAGKIIEWMEDMGYISPFDGAKARKVLITKEEFESKYGPL